MIQSKKLRIWWWVLLVLVLAGLGLFLYMEMGREPETQRVVKKVSPVEIEPSPVETEPVSDEPEGIPQEEAAVITGVIEKQPPPGLPSEEDYCTQIERDVADFFVYLDGKKEIRHLDSEMDSYKLFKRIVKKMAARPPIPAGENLDPKIIIQNMYHFFRVLHRKDLRLIREVMRTEQDTMENNLEMFYTWLTLGDRCPDPEGVRPSLSVLYQYAGFFLNTIGGRAYLSRRSPSLRLLVSYYCLLIVHETDKKRKNNYGIDIFPYIAPLKKEIARYPDLKFQGEYIEQLNQIETYYLNKR